MAEKAQPAVAETPAATKLNHVALWAMITGIAGLTIVWNFPAPWSIAAVILGHIGLSQVKRGNGHGRGYAIAGLVTGYVGIAAATVFIGMAVAVFMAGGLYGVDFMPHGDWGFDAPGMMNP